MRALTQAGLPILRRELLRSEKFWHSRVSTIQHGDWAGLRLDLGQAHNVLAHERAAMLSASCYALGASATRHVFEAASTLTTSSLYESELPSESGFLLLAEDIPGTEVNDPTGVFFPIAGVRLLSWYVSDAVTLDPSDRYLIVSGLTPWPERRDGLRNPGAPAAQFDETVINLRGEPFDLSSANSYARGVVTAFLTTLLFMQQNELTTVTPTKVRVPHPKKPREQRTEYVSVIDMRNYEPTPHAKSDCERRTTDHRWVVSGHWRNQWYPKRGIHRPKWIPGHIKGPEGAPLRHVEKVHALRAVTTPTTPRKEVPL